MSSFLVYLIMQADSILGMVIPATAILGVASIMMGIAAAMDKSTGRDSHKLAKAAKTAGLCTILGILITGFMPNTKTLAAMVVLPQITSPQAIEKIGHEGMELLELAKDALRNPNKDAGADK